MESSTFLRMNMSLAVSRKQSLNRLAFAFLLGSVDREKETNQAEAPFSSFQ